MPNLLFSKDSITYIIITGVFCFVLFFFFFVVVFGWMIESYDP